MFHGSVFGWKASDVGTFHRFTGHRLEFHVVSQVASFGSLFVAPPVGLALGATSAAAGVSSTTGDVVGDAEPWWVDCHLDITDITMLDKI